MNDVWQRLAPGRADAMLAAELVLAIGVTIHILLHKREVASAVGWIGLVWFAPVLGTAVYLVLGVNRVKRRARRLRPRDRIAGHGLPRHPDGMEHTLDPLGRGIGCITGRPLLAGTGVTLYQNGDAAYPPMLAAIAGARASVAMSSYLFHDDLWGGRFIVALADAKARGVAVRVIIDGIGGGWITSPAYRQLRRTGVPAARFMHSPLPWRMPFLNLRSHKKILLTDGILGFTGGMNIADENVMATHPATPVQDLHFRIEGPVVRQLAETFVEDWAFVTGEDLQGDAWLPDIPPGTGAVARVIDSGPDGDLEKIEFAVLQAVSCARSSIAVMTPYFLPDGRLLAALSLAAMRGVDVDIVIPEKSNHPLLDWATRANIGPLLADGARIWHSPSPFHHSKMMVVDTEWCLIGSCNWDIRSFRLNFELCMEVYDSTLATRLTDLLHAVRGRGLTQSGLDARSFSVRLRDAGARLLLPYL